jgi:hypothetical protein
MTKRALSAIGVSVAIACALYVSDAQAQWFAMPSGPGAWYFGPEGGWTGLQGTKTSITGTNPITGQTFNVPINQSFNSGWNVGARAGYQLGPWRFEGEYTHRQNSGDVTGPLGRLKGTFDTNSFMANGIYDFSLGWPITPHIGFGLVAFGPMALSRRPILVSSARVPTRCLPTRRSQASGICLPLASPSISITATAVRLTRPGIPGRSRSMA